MDTKETKQELKGLQEIADQIAAMKESFDIKYKELEEATKKQIEELNAKHEKELAETKESNKKLLSGLILGTKKAEAEIEKQKETTEEEDDENDMTIEAVEKRTRKILMEKFHLNKK